MDGQFEESEMVDVIDVSYRVIKVKQQKCSTVVVAAARSRRHSDLSVQFAAGAIHSTSPIKVALDKYLDPLPLARQQRIMWRHGLEITMQTLWDQLDALAQRLRPSDVALFKHALAQPVVGLDQTSWGRLDGRPSRSRSKCWHSPTCATRWAYATRAILETLYSTGIRRMEVISLTVCDLDMERGTLMVRQGKGKRIGWCPSASARWRGSSGT